MTREKSAGVIIYRMENGVPNFLLLHYFSGHWEFAKGHVDTGETEEETAKREAFEETGINDLKIIPGFKRYIKYFFRQNKKNVSAKNKKKIKTPLVFKVVTFFIAETKTKDIKISPEHKGYLWLPIKEAVEKVTFKNSKNLLQKANDFIISRKSI